MELLSNVEFQRVLQKSPIFQHRYRLVNTQIDITWQIWNTEVWLCDRRNQLGAVRRNDTPLTSLAPHLQLCCGLWAAPPGLYRGRSKHFSFLSCTFAIQSASFVKMDMKIVFDIRRKKLDMSIIPVVPFAVTLCATRRLKRVNFTRRSRKVGLCSSYVYVRNCLRFAALG